MDLNSDLGEGYGPWAMGDDAALLDIVTSANIACGFHAGDPSIMRRTVELASERQVAIGAHVSYPDRRGFGRYDIDLPPAQVRDDVLYQIGALDALARAAGSRVSYVKPHGALYNRITTDPTLARAVVEAITAFNPSLPLLTQPGGAAHNAATAAALPVAAEGFADRAYHSTGRLVPRTHPGAVISDPDLVAQRVINMALHHTVTTIDDQCISLRVDSICLHGDTPGAVHLARVVRSGLESADIRLRPFAQHASTAL
ncbi:MAG: LamB/YcsF family protein [Dermatophilaceae bacterium]